MPHQCTNCGKVFPDGSKEMLSGCPDCGGNKFQFRPSGSAGSTDGAASSTRSEGTDRSPGGSTPTPSDAPTTGSRPSASSEPDAPANAGSSDGGAAKSPTWERTAERAVDAERSDRPTADAPDETARGDASPDSTKRGGLSGRANRVEQSVRDWVSARGETDSTPATSDDSTPATNDNSNPTASREQSPASESAPASTRDSAPRPNDPPTAEPDREDSAQASARSAVVSPDEIAAAADRAAVEEADGPPSDADGTVIEPESDERPGLDDLREELNDQFESIKIVAPGEYELNLMELYDRSEYIISLREDGRYVIEVPDSWGDREPDE